TSDRTSSCDERRCVHGSAAHTCWQAACSRCPRASSSAPEQKRESGQFQMHLFPPAAPTRWSPAVIPQHIQECRKVTWSCQPAMPQSPHTCRLHQRRHTIYKRHPSHVIRTSFRHTATRQTEVFVTPCTSPHNQIVHAPRTAAAHTHSDKCSSDQCYPRGVVGSKQKRRAAKPQRVPQLAASQWNAATQMNSVLMPSTSRIPPLKPQETQIKGIVK
ncbi:hypothetical protein TcCL_ESM09865, partial [Trypanosoma cruzi]